MAMIMTTTTTWIQDDESRSEMLLRVNLEGHNEFSFKIVLSLILWERIFDDRNMRSAAGSKEQSPDEREAHSQRVCVTVTDQTQANPGPRPPLLPSIACFVFFQSLVLRTSRARVKALGIRLNGTRPKNKSRDIPSDFSFSHVVCV